FHQEKELELELEIENSQNDSGEVEETESNFNWDNEHTNEDQDDFNLDSEIHFEDFKENDSFIINPDIENALTDESLKEDLLKTKEDNQASKETFWSAKGRIRRSVYFLRIFLLGIAMYIIILAIGADNEVFSFMVL